MFIGFVVLGQTLKFLFQAVNKTTGEPQDADAVPTFRVYGDDGLMANGVCTMTIFDPSNTDGLYQGAVSITGGDGYEKSKHFTVRVLATVAGVQQTEVDTFVVV